MMRNKHALTKFLPLFFLVFVSFIISLPLLKSGFIPTHDGEYHLIRFWQFDKNIKKGIFFPRWAPDLDNGFGVPLFSFFYPFPNYSAEVFHLLGFSFVNSFKLSLAMALILSGIFFYLWMQKLFGSRPALVGSLFYLFAPYHFLDLFIRGSIGEIWALVWLPAILWCFQRKSFVLAGLFFALLILSHNILALIFTSFLVIYVVVNNRRDLFKALILGLGLSAYFWLPALAERKFVAGLELINFTDHFPTFFQLIFPSWGTGFSVAGVLDGMSFQIGLAHLLVVFLALFFSLKRYRFKNQITFFLGWFFLLVFLSLEVSLPFWKLIPFMKYIQYPWRLNSLIIVVTSFLAGWVAAKLKRKAALFFLIFLVVGLNWRYGQPVIYLPRSDSFYLENPVWTQGTATLGNSFNTVWSKEHPDFDKKLEVLEGEAVVKKAVVKPTDYSFEVEAVTEAKLRVNTNHFPGWQVLVDGQKAKIDLKEDGAFGFSLPKGSWQVKVEFKETLLRLFADALSIISFFILALVVIYHSALNLQNMAIPP